MMLNLDSRTGLFLAGLMTSPAMLQTSAQAGTLANNMGKRQITSVYSADENICVPLQGFLQALHRKHPKTNYLSDFPNASFKKAPFKLPELASSPDSQELAKLIGSTVAVDSGKTSPAQGDRELIATADQLFKLNEKPEQGKIILRLQNFNLGSHGDYLSNVYFLDLSYTLNAERLASESRQPKPHEIRAREVLFEVKSDLKDVIFPKEPQSSEIAKELLGILKGNANPQFPILFGTQLYVVAGFPLTGRSIVYEQRQEKLALIVCAEEIR